MTIKRTEIADIYCSAQNEFRVHENDIHMNNLRNYKIYHGNVHLIFLLYFSYEYCYLKIPGRNLYKILHLMQGKFQLHISLMSFP